VKLRTEDHLGDALAVTQVDEDQTSMIASGSDPTAQGDVASNIRGAQGAAEAVTVVHGKVEGGMKPET
jgi:hypothetical protein